MSGNFHKNTANFFVTLLIGLIVVSFMFTGYESQKATPDAIAQVGSFSIKGREYDNEYRRQINFYKNALFGGRELSAKDIERFNIKGAALQNLVQSKYRLIFAEKADIYPSPAEVKKMIKEFEFFQTAGSFDIKRYKGLLAANSMTPTDFEDDMRHDILRRSTQSLAANVPVSDNYLSDIHRFKTKRFQANIVEIQKSALKPMVPVSGREVTEFLAQAPNKARVESLFKQRKASLDSPEKVKASHILIKGANKESLDKINALAKKVTARNFKSMANKNTQDPSGKNNGGSLGEFARGRMVPEFDQVAFSLRPGQVSKPVKTSFGYHLIYVEKKTPAVTAKLNQHQNKIAQELIRDEKTKELDELATKVQSQIAQSLQQNDMRKVQKLVKQYNLKLDNNVEINRYDGSKGSITLDREQMAKVYASMKSKDRDFLTLSSAKASVYVALKKNFNKDLPVFDHKKERSGLQRALSNKMTQDITKQMSETVKVKQFVKL